MVMTIEAPGRSGIELNRFFTTPGQHPYDAVSWERRVALIAGDDGASVFQQEGVEVPAAWSQTATNVVVSKYFRGPLNTPQRETSVRQLIDRVVNTITGWGLKDGYFDQTGARTFSDELTHLLLHQYMAFNSPVWFNVGVEAKPQCSACFILSVDDTMESILDWCRTEGMIFKGGSGSGINLSKIRSSHEGLSAGGQASGPVSFMRGADSIAGSIKSGGKTRRAAKMVVLNVDHPDIIEFIECKANEERKAYALGAAGWDMSLNGDAWSSIQFQNANNSVRVSDEFMRAALEGRDWELKAIIDDRVMDTVRAGDLLTRAARAAWDCGDPGMQYDDNVNRWHTCPAHGRINASNPCSEYMHLDDSACNLASLNLLKFQREDGSFDIPAFKQAVEVTITAQEIIVGNSSYPTPKIGTNARKFRQLGLGYANLGALLMSLGIPYDSEAGVAMCGAITALMTGHAYLTSSVIASQVGPFEGYGPNREAMLAVMRQHRAAVDRIDGHTAPAELHSAARAAWDEAIEYGEIHGYRNAQATVLAPTGTIAFMMDCDTTGIEPDIALVKYKKLVGGGIVRIVNQTVPNALRRLGYDEGAIEAILAYVDENGMIEGAPGLAEEHLPVFDCAFQSEKGTRFIHHMGHVRMMAAAQPFISGAISKTVNLPESATVDDIVEVYTEAWRRGLKAIAIYRDGSKKVQPVSTTSQAKGGTAVPETQAGPVRHRLPDTRQAMTHKFSIEGHEGYITAGLYEHGQPGEIFLTMAKEGSTLSGMMDAFATSISLAFQYGVPLRDLVQKFSHMRFEPSGFTENPDIRTANSIVDYIFRWLGQQFLNPDEREALGLLSAEDKAALAEAYAKQTEFVIAPVAPQTPAAVTPPAPIAGAATAAARPSGPSLNGHVYADAPPCTNCGWLMVRSGTCYRCENCGSTSGCS